MNVLYGVAYLALFFGIVWLASVIFRRGFPAAADAYLLWSKRQKPVVATLVNLYLAAVVLFAFYLAVEFARCVASH